MTEKKKKSNKGGTVELAPAVAAGLFYVGALKAKKGRKMKGGEGASGAVPAIEMIPTDVRRESPAAAVTGSAAQSPLVAGMLDLSKNSYLGGVSSSRPAYANAPGGLLEGGSKKKRSSRKYKGGDCHPMDAPIPTNAGAGGDIRALPVVVGAVGGVSQQETQEMLGGARKRRTRKTKKRGGAEGDAEEGMPVGSKAEDDMSGQEGGARKRKGKKKGGDGCGMAPLQGGAKKRRSKKRGGAEGDAEGDAEGADTVEGGETAEKAVAVLGGGSKKRGSKKRGGADPEAFNAGDSTMASAMGGFDNLLADIKQQVGGKSKTKGGAFKLYAKELESLSKKLKKLL